MEKWLQRRPRCPDGGSRLGGRARAVCRATPAVNPDCSAFYVFIKVSQTD